MQRLSWTYRKTCQAILPPFATKRTKPYYPQPTRTSRSLSSRQREHEQHRAGFESMEFRRGLQQVRVERAAATDMQGDELLAADRVADRRAGDRRPDIEAPQRLQLLIVKGGDRAVERGAQHEAAGGRQHAGIVGVVELCRRLELAGRHVDGCNHTAEPLVATGDPATPERAAHARLVDLERRATVNAGPVGQVLRRAVRGR